MDRKETIEKVISNLKSAWETNPDLPFGVILSLVEENTNTPFMALRDEDIIKLTENMDVSAYVQPTDLSAMIEELKVGTVYDSTDRFVGYTILLDDDTPLREANPLYAYTDISYTGEIEPILLNECGGFKDELVCEDVLFATTVTADAAIEIIQKYYEEEVFEPLEDEY